MRIACLHTAASNAAVFDAACPPGESLTHAVRPDLLAAAEAAGGLTPEIAAETAEVLRRLDGDAVLLTCSTLGPAAGYAGAQRADAALAARACAGGGSVEVLCAAPSTLRVTAELFATAAQGTPARVTLRLVPGAWALFHRGDLAGYAEAIAKDAEASRADVVALAQVSMAPAARLARRPVLTVPEAALAACLERS
ncbi:MAG TPA: hypothetical protein VLA52_06060 [Thermohalobaculum sp.]|nr:hypothetical protein [Thermohalobaculum sp.]